MTQKRTLVAIFAHPDDEAFGTGGTLTKYAQQGVEVHLVTATLGEAGQIANPNVTAARPLSLTREQELRRACEKFGVTQLHLLGYVDGQTAIVPPAEAVLKIVRLLRRLKPQVVISFGPDGIYGHFDHLVIHRWASAAVELAANPERWPEAGPVHSVAKFYHRAISQTQLAAMSGANGRAAVDMGGVPFPFVGQPEEKITTRIDVRAQAQTKLAGLKCHISQLSPDTPYLQPDFDPLTTDWFRQETFILAQCNGVARPAQKEDDLFAGVE